MTEVLRKPCANCSREIFKTAGGRWLHVATAAARCFRATDSPVTATP